MPYYNLLNDDIRLIVSFGPKCASTTLRDWFHGNLPRPLKLAGLDTKIFMIPSARIDRYQDHAKVLFIRDPFRRLVSFYCQWVVRQPSLWNWADDGRRYSLKGKSFSAFLATLEEVASAGHGFQHHLIHQTTDIAGVAYDAVIPVEELHTALLAMNEILGLDYVPPRLNASPYEPSLAESVCDAHPDDLARRGIPAYRFFYNADLVSLAARLYRDDIAYYRRHYEDSILFSV